MLPCKSMAEKKTSKLEEALELKNKLDSVLREAKEEALAQIGVHLATLKNLGFTYEVVEGPQTGARSSRGPRAAGEKRQRFCKLCGNSGHNARTCAKRKK